MNKKGKMTLEQIIIVVLLIASFAVILLWWFFIFKPTQIVSEETCHNSILMRDTANIKGIGLGIEAIPLRCQTKNICYTKGLTVDKIKNLVIRKKVVECPKSYTKIKVKNKQELIKDLVERQARWWSIVGEGKLDYQPKDLSWTSSYCMISNVITFDSSIIEDKEMGAFPYNDFLIYMEKNNVPGKNKNYLEYLYGIKKASEVRNEIKKEADYDKTFFNANLEYVIISGMAKSGWLETGSIGAATFAGTAVLAYFSGGTFSIILKMAGVEGALGIILGIRQEEKAIHMPPTILPFDSIDKFGLGCKQFSTLVA